MEKAKVVIMNCDSPNLNGRIYSSEMMKQEIEKFNDRIKNDYPVLGMIHNGSEFKRDVNFAEISHKTTAVNLDNDSHNVVGEIEILDTPYGKMLQKMIDSGCQLGCEIVGHGEIDPETHHVNNFNLERIDIIDKEHCAWKESGLTVIE